MVMANKKYATNRKDHTGYAKLNVNGSYATDGSAGTGMALRDHTGTIIFVACQQLFICFDASPITIEMDC
jgi:hypothetical protein